MFSMGEPDPLAGSKPMVTSRIPVTDEDDATRELVKKPVRPGNCTFANAGGTGRALTARRRALWFVSGRIQAAGSEWDEALRQITGQQSPGHSGAGKKFQFRG